jgi:hypothetical protein
MQHRSHLPAKERSLRSRIAKLVHSAPILRGSITIRKVTCGNPNCRCAKGKKHLAMYITSQKDGKVRQRFVPKDKEEEVRRWVANYHKVCDLVDELSNLFWDRVKLKGK